MKKLMLFYLLFMLSLLLSAQDFSKGARIHNGQFQLIVELGISLDEQNDFVQQYDLDSLMAAKLFRQNFRYINDSTDWKVSLISPDKVLLTKALSAQSQAEPDLSAIILSEIFAQESPFPVPADLTANYGINRLLDAYAFQQYQNESCFFLRGHKKANKVVLAGSFNNWNTMQNTMQKTDSGWVSCMPLSPGKHTYKYIIDGRWHEDPANQQTENNEHGTVNSVVFVYNYNFELTGFHEAAKVYLAGSFNSWNPEELRMQKTESGWQIPMFLRKGTYSYKFIVDGSWILDPDNPDQLADSRGNTNSVLSFGNKMQFILPGYKDAKKVVLSGSFNNWNPDEIQLERTPYGWETTYAMAPGLHEYKYVVDGQWLHDPANPYTTGEPPYLNSLIAIDPNHIFVLEGNSDAIEVLVSGSFNGWRKDGYRMQRRNNSWIFPIHLQPGRYTYKFVIDGEWITDPDNPYYEKNEFDTDNSVLWIEQE